jgi:hypothetical protein
MKILKCIGIHSKFQFWFTSITSGIPTILTILNMVRKLLNEYHYYILDDSARDTLFVQHYFELHWLHLTSRGIYSNDCLVW